MNTVEKTIITVDVMINAPVEKVWKCWTTPEDIKGWNFASPDWCCPNAENDLKQGGKFSYRMEAKDGSMGFDFWGIYDKVIKNEVIESHMGDGRKLSVTFSKDGNQTKVIESFEAESTNPIEMQRGGWQSILNYFKKYTEES